MALIFSPRSLSSASIPSCLTFFGKPPSSPPSVVPDRKLAITFPSPLFSQQVSSFRRRSSPKAPAFAPSPSPLPFSCIKSSSCVASTGFCCFAANGDLGFRVDEDEEEQDEGSPWEGAVVYRRDASVAHLEYCTTLDRLGLGKLSTDLSRSRASAMGIRLVSTRKGAAVGDLSSSGTPVLISLDVTRKKRKLMLEGIVRTVITLRCNRCGEPAAETVFSNFTLLLSEEPIEEPEEINMRVIYGENNKARSVSAGEGAEDDEDERWIDLDDRLYFPGEEKEIDISKHIRDMVHVEITMKAVCDAGCKGLCLDCGTNLNRGRCSCHEGDGAEPRKRYGPLGTLKTRMQHT